MSFRVQGAPSQIQSNKLGAGLIEGDQVGDQLPGLLASLQESPEASKTSALYYQEGVGSFNQPSYQRSFGAFNISMPINRFGDSASVEINPDIFWNGPMMISAQFPIPYAYYGPTNWAPFQCPQTTTLSNVNTASVSQNVCAGAAGDTTPMYLTKAGPVTSRPRMFYSWGAGYANIKQIRMNLGGAMIYLLDTYANWIGVMASTATLAQRACLMKASGGGTLIPDTLNELQDGLAFETAEPGSIQLYSADGGLVTATNVVNTLTTNLGGTRGNTPALVSNNAVVGSANMVVPLYEHWLTAIKTPNTNFTSMQQYRRPIDTRLFSSNFMLDIFTAPNLDQFVDSGTGFQPQLGAVPSGPSIVNQDAYSTSSSLYLQAAFNYRTWNPQTDGLFPCCVYRQFNLPTGYDTGLAGSATGGGQDTEFTSLTSFAVSGADYTPFANRGGAAVGCVQDYRLVQFHNWKTIALSAGYASATGFNYSAGNANAVTKPNLLTASNLPVPTYWTIINARRLANDQLGARQVLETRPDLAVYYPFQHLTTQVYFVNQLQTNTYASAQSGAYTSLTNTGGSSATSSGFVPYGTPSSVAGSQGFGGVTELALRTTSFTYSTNSLPLSVPISIPVNPLTCLYICVFREKDRIPLGYSTPGGYSPVLFWNALELVQFRLNYSAQILQKYGGHSEYAIQQLHERLEPLVVPFRGGIVTRSSIDPGRPDYIQNDAGFPGSWYNAYIYEFCMVDQLPFKNEAFLQQTPSFRGELLDFQFTLRPTLRRSGPMDFDFRSSNIIPMNYFQSGSSTGTTYANFNPATIAAGAVAYWATYMEKIAPWCHGIPQTVCGEDPGSINWNLNNDNLSVVCVFAQNALWQLNPLFTKVVFARGA